MAESEEINSDLDDSDTDAEEEDQDGALGETDIVFCTYDKVSFSSGPDGTPFVLWMDPTKCEELIIFRQSTGRPCQKQMEVCSERWDDSHQREGLFIREVHLVRPFIRVCFN